MVFTALQENFLLINQPLFDTMSGHLNYMIDFLVLLGIPKTVLEPNLVQDCARKSKT